KLGIVGESGSGKSVTLLSILRLVPHPGETVNGEVRFRGQNLLTKSAKEMRQIRGKDMAMIFQDPMTTLNPAFLVGEQIRESLRIHNIVPRSNGLFSRLFDRKRKAAEYQRVWEAMADVGIPVPRQSARRYPHQFSGGMQQRIMIAIALACEPQVLLADEPTTALDVTIQAQILSLLAQLREERGLSILLITHNLGVVAETCDRVAVLYVGHVVEQGPTREIFKAMKHPYTKGLMAAIPRPGSHGQSLPAIHGSVPSGLERFLGCPFRPRCSWAMDVCEQKLPALIPVGREHYVACHLYTEAAR
ncbi:MAG: ABC transporter ATP-binding protein, partial [Planctomycetes bacterium]|nr:ABC transporter ATP-binding protein [Planctomycetota bacterium]